MEDFTLSKISEKLDRISPAFCLAKYDLFTLHLHLGSAHSCHLALLKQLNIDDIKGPYDFFNFPEIKQTRKKMKDGIKDKECQYCWEIEKNSNFSDRHVQSLDIQNRYDEIIKMDPLKDDIIPAYLEVSFSNLCNFKCSYCNPNFSNRWENDLKKYGDFNNETSIQSKRHPVKQSIHKNLFVQKFQQYFPEIVKGLKTLRITGGEPIIQKELYDILDYIDINPQPNLTLSINTNLCPSPKIFNDFINKLKNINHKVKRIFIYTSCDSSGEHAEFIREGLNYSVWKENCHRVLKEINNSHLNIMCTFNNLCLTEEFKIFIKDLYDMTEYSIGKSESRFYVNLQPLFYPVYQSVEILDYDIFEKIIDEIQELLNSFKMITDKGIISSKGFLNLNIEKFNNIKDLIKNSSNNSSNNKKNFLYFLNQCKIRNGKDYSEIFNDDNYKRFFSKIKDNRKNLFIFNTKKDHHNKIN